MLRNAFQMAVVLATLFSAFPAPVLPANVPLPSTNPPAQVDVLPLVATVNSDGKGIESDRAAPVPIRRPVGPDSITLRLRAGYFDPLQGELPVPTSMRRALAAGQAGLRLVQFPGPIQGEWYAAMLKAGLDVVTYIPDYAYLVWGTDLGVASLGQAAPLRWSGVYQPFYALHPDLANLAPLPGEMEVVVQVYEHPGAEDTVQLVLSRAAGMLGKPHLVLTYRNFAVRIMSSELEWLAALPDVVNVEPRVPLIKFDEVQGQIMAGNLNPAGTQPSGPGYLNWLSNTLGFTTAASAYPIVDVTDDGIDNGTTTPLHPDFYTFGNTARADRLIYNYNWTTDASADGVAGHGNINASIVGGYNDKTGFPYEDGNGYNYGLGINPLGRLAGSKVFKNAGGWDAQGTYTELISNTYALGARISSNSWGAPVGGAYTSDSQEYDALVRDAQPGSGAYAGNQEIMVVFAAGNDGSGANTVGTPGTAKNVLTVGASENYRPTWTDGCGIGPTGADNAQDIISFSSRGPTDDSRFKPEIVAPGTHIEGAASQATGYNGVSVCDQYMPVGQTWYAASSGTSHSTPAIAGAASLLYRYYQDHFGGNPPSPAMTKAYLVNATRYLTGTDAGDTLPSNSQGYGEINLGTAFDATPRLLIDQGYVFHSTGQVYQISGQVASTSRPFRVTLAWTDAPGPTVGNAYVNNLDLAVTIGGQTFQGNVFSGASSTTGGSADARNNVESVFLPAGTSGAFTLVITATNVAGDGVPGNGDPTDQDFALVVYNHASPGLLSGQVTNASTAAPVVGATVLATNTLNTFQTASGAGGLYSMVVASGTYTLVASSYGYVPSVIVGVVVTTGTTTRNIALTPALNSYVVSGVVRDAATGWPLYASLDISGYPSGTIWSNPVTGYYSVTLLEGSAFDLMVNARVPGYNAASRTIGPLTGNSTQDFSLEANATTCNAPGYQRPAPLWSENFDSVSAPTLPANWATVDITLTGGSWATNAGTVHPSGTAAHSAPNLAYFNSWTASSGSSTRLYRLAGLDLSGISGIQVVFWMYHDTGYTWDDRVQVQVSTDGGTVWNDVGATIPRYDGSVGWKQHTVDISAYTGAGKTDVRIGFLGISAYGNDIHIDDVAVGETTCTAPSGGLVVGNVYDANTGAPLTGAQVSNDSGRTATAVATPDPVVPDSLYTLFSPAGLHTFTATMSGGYAAVVSATNVSLNSTVRQDFNLPAGRLSAIPTSVAVRLALGANKTVPLTLTNTGGAAMAFELQEYIAPPPDVWSGLTSTPQAVSRPAGAEVGGKFYIIGGESSGPTFLGQVQVYDPATGTWNNSLPTMPTPGSNVCAAVIGSDIYLPAGSNASGAFNTLQVFHTASNTWETISTDPLPGPTRLGVTCASLDGRLYAFGGFSTSGGTLTWYNDSYTYNPVAAAGSRWTQIIGPATPSAFGAALAVNNLIFYAGLSGTTADLANVYAYNSSTNSWAAYPNLQTARGGARMWAIANMLYVGGGGWDSYLTSVEKYDTSLGTSGSWSYADSLNQGRRTFAAATDPASGNLFAGAGWAGAYLTSAERYPTPVNITWLSESPISGTVTAGGNQPGSLTFDAAGLTVGTYTGRLKVANNTPYSPINVPVTLTISTASYGVMLESPTATQFAVAGATATYTLRLTNTGTVADTFTLSKSGNAWTTDAPGSVGPLGSGAGANLQVIVHIPSGVSDGATDMVTITATSQADLAQSDDSTLRTTASFKLYLPIILTDVVTASTWQ